MMGGPPPGGVPPGKICSRSGCACLRSGKRRADNSCLSCASAIRIVVEINFGRSSTLRVLFDVPTDVETRNIRARLVHKAPRKGDWISVWLALGAESAIRLELVVL